MIFPHTQLVDVSFQEASLQGAQFVGCSMEKVSFDDADLTGATFRGCTVKPWEGISFFGTKMGAETFDSLIGEGGDDILLLDILQVKYRKYGAEDARQILGCSRSEFDIMIWAGDVEVRDNKTLRQITGAFDSEKHHIPEWFIVGKLGPTTP